MYGDGTNDSGLWMYFLFIYMTVLGNVKEIFASRIYMSIRTGPFGPLVAQPDFGPSRARHDTGPNVLGAVRHARRRPC